MRIQNNIMAMNTHRMYTVNNSAVQKSAEKLSSGYRINRAGDDAAGLAISEKMRAQIRGLNMASKNSQDAVSLVQTAEGALQEVHSMLQRMNELAVQSASGTNDSGVDRAALQQEFENLQEEIDQIAETTTFNDMTIMDGTYTKGDLATTGTTTIAVNAMQDATGDDYKTETGDQIKLKVGSDDVTLTATVYDGETVWTASGAENWIVTATEKTAGTITLDIASMKKGPDSPATDKLTVTDGGYKAISGATVSNYTVNAASGQTKGAVGTGFGLIIQTGAEAGQTLAIYVDDMNTTGLKVDKATAKIDTQANAAKAVTATRLAINKVSTQRAELGAMQNRLEHKISNLDNTAENLSAAESRIRDVDMAKEMTNFTKQNILSQAATAMLAQANAAPQGVLSLLQ